MLGVLVFDTLPGLFIGISTSLVLLLYRASRPNVAVLGRLPSGDWVDQARSDDAAPEPGVVVLRVEAGLFFANSDHVRQTVLAHARENGVHAVVLDAETIAVHRRLGRRDAARAGRRPRARRRRLLVARDIGQVRDVLGDEDSGQRLYPTVEAAVTQAR